MHQKEEERKSQNKTKEKKKSLAVRPPHCGQEALSSRSLPGSLQRSPQTNTDQIVMRMPEQVAAWRCDGDWFRDARKPREKRDSGRAQKTGKERHVWFVAEYCCAGRRQPRRRVRDSGQPEPARVTAREIASARVCNGKAKCGCSFLWRQTSQIEVQGDDECANRRCRLTLTSHTRCCRSGIKSVSLYQTTNEDNAFSNANCRCKATPCI